MSSSQVELDTFRDEVKGFLAANVPPATAERVKLGYYIRWEEILSWHKALARRGWSVQNWPIEHGGTGWSLMQKYIFDEECARAGAPIIPGASVNMVGTLILNFGNNEQKERFLPPIRSGEEIWCQAWSEASAGSDLSNIKCRATREGGHYIVNGTKLWTSNAHRADWCMLLARTATGARKQEGISILLLDVRSPGITVRPIITIDGMHHTNEVHFDEVRVPAANLVGEEGKGWPMMRGIVLDVERLSAAQVSRSRSYLERLYLIARRDLGGGATLMENYAFRRRLAWLEIRTRALHTRMLEILITPSQDWGTMPSVLKLQGTKLQQDILEMMSEAAGWYGLPFHQDQLREGWGDEPPIGPDFATAVTPNFFYTRHLTISGGAAEIQRNMIAKGILG